MSQVNQSFNQDASGGMIIAGEGSAGTPVGGVLTIQGNNSGVAVPIQGSLTNITGTISLPTGAATSGLQTTGNASLASIDAGIPAALGATGSANSMPVVDIISISAQQQAQTVTTTAALALGGGTALANRKLLVVTPTTGTIFWGISSGVTITTGQPIFPNNALFLSFSIPVYLIAASSITAIVTEAS